MIRFVRDKGIGWPLVVLVGATCGWAIAEEKKEGAPPGGQDMAEMMAQYMKYMQPGENHKPLEYFVGDWDTILKMWMDPSQPPMESKGTAKFKWVLGKRFLFEEFKAEMEMPGPTGAMQKMPFEGMGMTGYDNYKNMYVSSWADNMGTQFLTMYGGKDHKTGKTFTYYGQMDEPTLNVQDRMVKYVTRIVDDNKFIFQIFDLHAGDDYRVLEVEYTRKK